MNKTRLPSIISLAILTAITTVFWIFFSVFRIFSNKENAIVPKEVLQKLNPVLDSKILESLEKKYYSEGGEAPTFMVVATPASTPLTTPTASPSSSPSTSPSASPSATIEGGVGL